jgi:flagellar biosynthesis/type III secretory pathway chaperone
MMDELYRSKTIKQMEEGIAAAAAMECHLEKEQQALVSQNLEMLQVMVDEKRATIDRLARFESEMMGLLKARDGDVASDNWVELIRSLYPDDQRVDETVGELRSRIAHCHALTVENEGLVNIGLARVSMAMQMLTGDVPADLYDPAGKDLPASRSAR